MIGYLICSRYETVWHVMNIAVDAEHQRRGVASALLAELYERVGDETARYTLEVRRSNLLAIRLYEREGFRAAGLRRRYYQDNGEDALVMWRTPATLGGPPRRRAQPGSRMSAGGPGPILALETSCDDTCAAVLDAQGRARSNVISSQGVHDRYGGVVPEIASRHHLELVNLVIEQALSEARHRRSGRSSWSRPRRAPAWSGRCWWGSPRPRRWRLRASCRSLPSIICRVTWPPTSSFPHGRAMIGGSTNRRPGTPIADPALRAVCPGDTRSSRRSCA